MEDNNSYSNVAVYGTLKKGYHNHRVMQQAEGKFVTLDYIQIKELGECGFPYIKLSDNSDKWLEVEIYRVDNDKLYIVDSLEGYEEGRANNHYERKVVDTLLESQVFVYEYARDIPTDTLENHFTRSVPSPRFYSWDRTNS